MAITDVYVSRSFPSFILTGTPNCMTTYPELFFPERGANGHQNIIAKRICKNCDYTSECLEWALENRETGIWGATTEQERRGIRRRRKNRVDN